MKICKKEYCIGCSLCANVCNSNAIKMDFDSEGFFHPVVNEAKCTKCNVCKIKCPANLTIQEKTVVGTYAYYTKDEELRKTSSSGGVFSELAKYVILEKKGVVVGAAFTPVHHLKHIIIDNIDDLEKLRGSKYLQSDTQDIYLATKHFLDSDTPVLFSGTPCQISALKSYVGDHKKLYTVDLFCHGVSSPGVFKKFLEETKATEKTDVEFRNKNFGWGDSCIVFDTRNGEYFSRHSQDVFFIGFVENLYLRKSCHSCKYNQLGKRSGDISIGDFWEVEKLYPELNDDKGINAVIINTERGNELFSSICRDGCYCKEVKTSDILLGNTVLKEPVKAHPMRKTFFDMFSKQERVMPSIRKCFNMGHKVAILNHSFSHDNYGAMMVAYSMEKIVERLGYEPETILFKWAKTESFDYFKKNYLHITDKVYELNNYNELTRLNKKYDTFLVGSDQVWRNWWKDERIYRWFLDFADFSKNLIAYSASFGIDNFDEDGCSNKKISKLAKAFSGASVREESGVDICKKKFNVDAKWVIDPTQLLKAEDYDEIIKQEKAFPPCSEPYLAYMIFPGEKNDNDETRNFINSLAAKLNLKTEPLLGKEKTVAEWLCTIKNASFVITESYHGTMFSIIFKKPFICLSLSDSQKNRMSSFFNKIGCLQERVFADLDSGKAENIAKMLIDWDSVYARLQSFKDESLEFLRTCLAAKVVNNGRKIKKDYKAFAISVIIKAGQLLPNPIKSPLKKAYKAIMLHRCIGGEYNYTVSYASPLFVHELRRAA